MKKITQKGALVVEDDPDFADLLSTLLEREGLDTSIASDGQEALEVALVQRPDPITLDIQLPRKSGLLFYRQMKLHESLRNMPVIVVSGLTAHKKTGEVLIRSFLEVCHIPAPAAYLDKPEVQSRLASLIGEVLQPPTGRPI